MTNKELTMANLKKVLAELPELAKTRPSIIKDFNMRRYHKNDSKITKENFHTCNTCGCLLGNAALLFEYEDGTEIDETWSSNSFDYGLFSKKIFPFLSDDIWEYLFGIKWVLTQPSFEHAIKRLQFVVDNGLDFDYTPFLPKDIK